MNPVQEPIIVGGSTSWGHGQLHRSLVPLRTGHCQSLNSTLPNLGYVSWSAEPDDAKGTKRELRGTVGAQEDHEATSRHGKRCGVTGWRLASELSFADSLCRLSLADNLHSR